MASVFFFVVLTLTGFTSHPTAAWTTTPTTTTTPWTTTTNTRRYRVGVNPLNPDLFATTQCRISTSAKTNKMTTTTSIHAAAEAEDTNQDDVTPHMTIDSSETRTMEWLVGQSIMTICLVVGTGLILFSSPEISNAFQASDFVLRQPVDQHLTNLATDTASWTSSSVIATTTINPPQVAATVDWNSILQKASKKALGGGKAGASAAAVQVLSLMWLRTSMNRQYRYGGDLSTSLKILWEEGGIPRLYQGLPFALIQGPLTRFGDTAANVGVLALLETIPETQSLPIIVKTAMGSLVAGMWRIVLMPIDASKTAMQVEGSQGLNKLIQIAKDERGFGIFYQGSVAQAAATAVGHFPWYLTYNFLDSQLPTIDTSLMVGDHNNGLLLTLARSAFLGLCSSCVSDVSSNSLRVIKTTKQTARLGNLATNDSNKNNVDNNSNLSSTFDLSYAAIVKSIIEQDGLKGLFGRGLKTRLLTNAIQGAVFSVLWRYFQQTGGS